MDDQIHLSRRLPSFTSPACPRAEAGGLKILDMEIIRGHYAETLLHWRVRFLRNRDQITTLYDERFVRMWEFYLAGCEYFFRCQHGMVVQLQLPDDH